mmetsp:Transcript_10635/g.25360  ORF Transcript_10635/g.25360 Transcript_10635/m.25360 type:complete len:336 (-) Transcript_10635:233-1240(-)
MNTHRRDNKKDLVDAVQEMTILDGGGGRDTTTTTAGVDEGGGDDDVDHAGRHVIEECFPLNDISMSSLPRLEHHDENGNINSSRMSLTSSSSSRAFATVSGPTITVDHINSDDVTMSPFPLTPSSSYTRTVSLPEEEGGRGGCPVTPDLTRDQDHRQHQQQHLVQSQRRRHRHHPGIKILRRGNADETDDALSDQQSIDRRQLLTMRMNALSPSTTPQSRRKTLLGRRSVAKTTATTKTKTKTKSTEGEDVSTTVRTSSMCTSRSPSLRQLPHPIRDIMFIPSIPGIEDDDDNEEDDNHEAHDDDYRRHTTESSINTEGMSFDGKTLYFGWEHLR